LIVSTKYQRYYINLSEYHKGFGLDKSPSGHARIEYKNDRYHLHVEVSNLKALAPGFSYNCYLMSYNFPLVLVHHAGKLNPNDLNKNILEVVFANTDLPSNQTEYVLFNVVIITHEPDNNITAYNNFLPMIGHKDTNGLHELKQISEYFISFISSSTTKNGEERKPCFNKTNNILGIEGKDFFEDQFLNYSRYSNHENLDEKQDMHYSSNVSVLQNILSISFPGCKPFGIEDSHTKWCGLIISSC
jgi:hypothetical protein